MNPETRKETNMPVTITPETTIKELFQKHPQARRVFARYGMMCPKCQGRENETVKHAAHNHGLPLQKLLEELNAMSKR